ncbi:hypothetical protein [Reyranella sp. CPCC 100927]|uniref:hypothetical protein n=1 Tax=Reyranella sp. CPCC 100927 TaxID=2599616 RepID=UPI0011B66E1B|nr:hypothetical protein [Reyranella sp. CPCC 100927]TWT06001.1 hypothetical protein FQU96_23395 [Reyranella sp. CPCC 100927]
MRTARVVIAVLLALAPASALAQNYIYCINDRIEVDKRNLKKMQGDRGHSTICMIGPTFDSRYDALAWVEKYLRAKVDGPCSCK